MHNGILNSLINNFNSPRLRKEWLGTYENATYKVISRENYLDFIV